jgi:hypothetical protein
MLRDVITAKGYNGTVTFDGRAITISRTGLGRLASGASDKMIPLRSVTAVQLKPAGMLKNGYIAFTIPGGQEVGGGTYQAAKDENAVIFTKQQAADFDALRAAVNEALLS